jgi:hypothetical protein
MGGLAGVGSDELPLLQADNRAHIKSTVLSL